MEGNHTTSPAGILRRNLRPLLLMAGGALLGLFLIDGGRTLTAFLPYLLLAACPLMHLFMHRPGRPDLDGRNEQAGHGCCGGGRGAHEHDGRTARADDDDPQPKDA